MANNGGNSGGNGGGSNGAASSTSRSPSGAVEPRRSPAVVNNQQSPRGPTATQPHRRQASSDLDESDRHNPPGVRTPPRLSSAIIPAGAASARPMDSSGSPRDSRSQPATAPPAFRPGSLQQLPTIESLLQHPLPLQPPRDPFINLPSLSPYRFTSTALPQPLAYDLTIRDPDIPANILAQVGSRPSSDYELGWVRTGSNPAGSSPPTARRSSALDDPDDHFPLSTGRRADRQKSGREDNSPGQAESSTKARKKKAPRSSSPPPAKPYPYHPEDPSSTYEPNETYPHCLSLIKAYGRIDLSLCQRAQQSLVRHKGADDEIWKNAVPTAVKPFATDDQNDPFYIIQDFQARADSSTFQSVNFPRRQDYQYLIMVAGAKGAVEVPRGKECKRCRGIKSNSGVTEGSCRTFPYGGMGRYADRSCINCADTCTNCCLNPELKGKTPPQYDSKKDAEARKKFFSARCGYNDDKDIGGSGKDNQGPPPPAPTAS